MKDNFHSCLKWLVVHFIPNPGHAQLIQTGPGTSLCSCSGLSLPSRPNSLFLLTIPKQDQELLSAPCPYCLCQAGVSSRSVGKMQTQDCFTWSWSCKSWIFYGSFTVRLGPSLVWSGLVWSGHSFEWLPIPRARQDQQNCLISNNYYGQQSELFLARIYVEALSEYSHVLVPAIHSKLSFEYRSFYNFNWIRNLLPWTLKCSFFYSFKITILLTWN